MLVSDATADFLRRPLGTDASRSCSAAARRSVALGARRILTAASLRELTGLRVAGLEVVAVLRDVGASARAAPVLRLPDVPSDFAAAERVAGLFAVRMVRAAAVLVPVLRVVPESLRLVARAAVADFGERVVADLAARTGVLRVLVGALARVAGVRVAGVLVDGVRVDAARAAGARVDAARAGAARPVPARAADRPPTLRFAGAAVLARVVLTEAAFVPVLTPVLGPGLALVLAPIALPRVAGARLAGALAVLARDVGALATRGDFGAALAALGPGFFATADRVPAAVPVRVVRVVAARALVPAVRRPPARMAMARVRPMSELSSLLITGILFRKTEMECLRDTAGVVGRLGRATKHLCGTKADIDHPTEQHPGATSGTTVQRLGYLPKTASALSSTWLPTCGVAV